MAQFKLCVGEPKSKKTFKIELSEEQSVHLLGKKIGDTFKGNGFGLEGYEFECTGGSDKCGFPMRKDVQGTQRKRIFAVGGVGIKKNPFKGRRIRKTVAGNAINEDTVQINLKVLKAGKAPLGGEEKPTEEKPAEN